MVSAQPCFLTEADSSRSKIVQEMSYRRRAWASARPEIPAPICYCQVSVWDLEMGVGGLMRGIRLKCAWVLL